VALQRHGDPLRAFSLRAVFGLTLRQTQGFLHDVTRLLGVAVPVPHHSTFSRRAAALTRAGAGAALRWPRAPRRRRGLKIHGEGEWKVRVHGKGKRRVWRKRPLAVDTRTGALHAHALTASEASDGGELEGLLARTAAPVAAVCADKACDSFDCHAAILARHVQPFIGELIPRGSLRGLIPDDHVLVKFTRVVRQCQAAGLVSAETVHIDASLIRANVGMDALVARHLDAVEDANDAEREARTSGKFKKFCRTDPDATMATSSKAPLRPAYKQHTAVDDLAGVVVDVEVVTGEEHDTGRFAERLDAIEETLGATPDRITADTIYGVGRIYAALEDRQIEKMRAARPNPASA
jgi:hypothetical protein